MGHRGGSPARDDFPASRAGLRVLEGGDLIADKGKDQGHTLDKLTLVLEVIRLLVELLR